VYFYKIYTTILEITLVVWIKIIVKIIWISKFCMYSSLPGQACSMRGRNKKSIKNVNQKSEMKRAFLKKNPSSIKLVG
jgi:hypothetical protein